MEATQESTVFESSVRCIGRVIIYLQSKGGDETCPVGPTLYADHYTFLGVCTPTPPLSQHFVDVYSLAAYPRPSVEVFSLNMYF